MNEAGCYVCIEMEREKKSFKNGQKNRGREGGFREISDYNVILFKGNNNLINFITS